MFLVLIQKKKKIFNNLCNSNFPPPNHLDGSIACLTNKANLFGSYFSVHSSLSNFYDPDPPILLLTNPMPSIIISAHKVCQLLCSLKTNKASGSGGIPPRFLREFADELTFFFFFFL